MDEERLFREMGELNANQRNTLNFLQNEVSERKRSDDKIIEKLDTHIGGDEEHGVKATRKALVGIREVVIFALALAGAFGFLKATAKETVREANAKSTQP